MGAAERQVFEQAHAAETHLQAVHIVEGRTAPGASAAGDGQGRSLIFDRRSSLVRPVGDGVGGDALADLSSSSKLAMYTIHETDVAEVAAAASAALGAERAAVKTRTKKAFENFAGGARHRLRRGFPSSDGTTAAVDPSPAASDDVDPSSADQSLSGSGEAVDGVSASSLSALQAEVAALKSAFRSYVVYLCVCARARDFLLAIL